MKSGQILILVLLIVVVSLAIGLSVASRNLTNLKTSAQTEQSQRAFTAAEGGVEDVLSRLSKVATDISIGSGINSGCTIAGSQATCSVPVGSTGDITANVSVLANRVYETLIDPGKVGQIDLTNYGGSMDIEWAKSGTDEANSPASLEITLVCNSNPCVGFTDPATSTYKQNRFAYYISSRTDEQGFSACPAAGSGYACKVTLNLGSTNVRFARVRPFWKSTTVKVSGGAGFPVQIYELNSQASTDLGITRRVKVTRTALPTLPAAFDYALFSEGAIAK